MEEQRFKNLEEEFKVLKNQIKAVLLDIKEQLASGVVGQAGAPQVGSMSTVPAPQAENAAAEPPSAGPGPGPGPGFGFGPGPGPAEDGPSAGITSETETDFNLAEMNSRKEVGAPSVAVKNPDPDGNVDLLTVSVLSQWLSRAAVAVSKAQICKLVEIYDITGNLTPRMKQVLMLLADLYSNGSHAGDEETMPAAESVQLLIELDSLLRYRTGALESCVMSMLLDKGQKNRRGS